MKVSRLKIPFGPGATLLLAILALSFCAKSRPALAPASSTPPPAPSGPSQTGIASWYGADFHGRRTSNSEIYNMYDLTAAHKTLPFGTKVMVTNLTNGRAVCVRINDRGPFVPGRVIDLSLASARLIDMVGPGTAPVRLDILPGQEGRLKPVLYAVQVGAYAYEDNARSLEAELRRRYAAVQVKAVEAGSRTYYRVRIPAKDRPTSEALARRLSQDGYRVLICEYD